MLRIFRQCKSGEGVTECALGGILGEYERAEELSKQSGEGRMLLRAVDERKMEPR